MGSDKISTIQSQFVNLFFDDDLKLGSNSRASNSTSRVPLFFPYSLFCINSFFLAMAPDSSLPIFEELLSYPTLHKLKNSMDSRYYHTLGFDTKNCWLKVSLCKYSQRHMNTKLEDLIGSFYNINDALVIPANNRSKNKDPVKVTLNHMNSFFC